MDSSVEMFGYSGVWRNKEQLISLRRTQRKFEPDAAQSETAKNVFKEWLQAVERSRDWHKVTAS